MIKNTKLGLLTAGFGLLFSHTVFGQLAVITFNPSNPPGFNARVTAATVQASQYGSTGAALANMANSPLTSYYVTGGPDQRAGVGLVGSNGQVNVFFNSNPNTKFLHPDELAVATAQKEAPKDDATVLCHEFASGYRQKDQLASGMDRMQRETDIIRNYENPVRAASNQPARETYGGVGLPANQSVWSSLASWFRSIWE